MKPPEIHMLPVDQIKVFVHRDRDQAEWRSMVESIREDGLKVPIQVRDISGRPTEERKRPSGGLFKWELVYGEGRLLAFTELKKAKIPSVISDAPESKIVGRFLAENMIRKPLPWATKAKIIKSDFDAGLSPLEIGRKYHVTEAHVEKLLRTIRKTAVGIEADVAAMPMAEAEALTARPKDHQLIVVQALRESPDLQVRDLLTKAQEVVDSGKELSVSAIKASLQRVDESLAKARKGLKVIRLHHSLGPLNLQMLLGKKAFHDALVKAGVNINRFEEISE